MSPSFAEEQVHIEQRIGQALAGLLPDVWLAAVLEVTRALAEDGGETLTFSISSPENRREVVSPDEELIDAVRALSLLFARHGTPWMGLRYQLTRNATGEYDFRAEFTYPPEPDGENRRRFVATMGRYVEAAYPEDWQDLGPDRVTEVIELGITVAESYGITIERDVGYYIDLMFYLTFDFPDLKEASWIRKILRRRKLTGTEKMAQIRQRLGLA